MTKFILHIKRDLKKEKVAIWLMNWISKKQKRIKKKERKKDESRQ